MTATVDSLNGHPRLSPRRKIPQGYRKGGGVGKRRKST